MKKLLLALIALSLLSGCTTIKNAMYHDNQSDKNKADHYDSFSGLKDDESKPVPVYDIQEFPPANYVTVNGKEYAAFDKEGFLKLMEIKEQSKTNTEQLKNANKLLDLETKNRNEVYHAGIDLQEKANLEAEKVVEKEKDISAIKRKDFFQRWTERGIFAAVIYLVITLH